MAATTPTARNDRAPQLLADLADTVAAELVTAGIDEEQAADIGIKVADRMRNDWGGEPIYFPKGCAIDISRRDIEIWNAFPQKDHIQLAREYDLSVIHIYRILKTVGAAMRALRQAALF